MYAVLIQFVRNYALRPDRDERNAICLLTDLVFFAPVLFFSPCFFIALVTCGEKNRSLILHTSPCRVVN